MSTLVPFLVLNQTCEQAQRWVNQKLTGAGFRVVQTFDLHIARLAHPDCPCPHHGTNACDCQMVFLLIYWKDDDPATMVIHGQDSTTWLSLAKPVSWHADHSLEAAIRHAVAPQPFDVPSSVGASYGFQSPD